MYLSWSEGGGASSTLVSAVPESGLNHVGRHIRPGPSGPAYLLLCGAKASCQSEPSATDIDRSV